MSKRNLVYNVAKLMVLHKPSTLGTDESKVTGGAVWDLMSECVASTLVHSIEERQRKGCDCPDCLISLLDERTNGDLAVLRSLTDEAAAILKTVPVDDLSAGQLELYF